MIKKTYRMGTIVVDFRISDGVAIMTTNNHRVTEQLYKKASNSGKPNMSYNYRLHTFIEKFPNKTEKEIVEMLDEDMKTADEEGKRAKQQALKRIKK